MLSVLKKYHAAAENLSDSVKMSGDLKVWIKLDPNPGNSEEVRSADDQNFRRNSNFFRSFRTKNKPTSP
jgi:hypothetical protein